RVLRLSRGVARHAGPPRAQQPAGIIGPLGMKAAGSNAPFPDDLVLAPVSRWPTTLPDESLRAILDAPVERRIRRFALAAIPKVSVVIVTRDGLAFSRLCLETLLANTCAVDFEVIV